MAKKSNGVQTSMLQRIAFANLFNLFVKLAVVVRVFYSVFFKHLVKGRHTYIYVTRVYQIAHILKEKC